MKKKLTKEETLLKEVKTIKEFALFGVALLFFQSIFNNTSSEDIRFFSFFPMAFCILAYIACWIDAYSKD